MNAVGLLDDVNTLLHESGHSFHAFAAHRQPLLWQRYVGAEAAELASMSMELLAAPYLAEPGGLVTPENLRLARIEHLEDVLVTLAHIASVDAFQRWIYTSGEGGDARRAGPGLGSYPGPLPAGRGLVGPRRGAGLPMVPAAAHLPLPVLLHRVWPGPARGAPGVAPEPDRSGGRRRRVPRGACAGCTAPLPAMYARAGAQFGADPALMKELVELVEDELGRLGAG